MGWQTSGPWEYRVMRVSSNIPQISEGMLDSMGDDRWELVSVDNGTAYFKRPL